MTRRLSIVIPSWNGRELLQRFLPSVMVAAGESEVVISDDGSSDGTAAWLEQAYPQARCVASAANRGFAPAAHAGIEAARGEIVVLLNNDLEVAPDCLGAVAEWFEDGTLFGVTFRAYDLPERTFATGGKLGRWRRGFWETWRNYEAGAGGGRDESFMLVGGFCAFRRQAYLEMGGLDPIFAPYYSEDLDLSYRARKRGWRLGYEPRAKVYHARSSSVNRHRGRFRRQAVIERNRLLFHWRNLDGGRLARHLLWAHALLAQNLLKGNWAYHAGYAQALARVGAVRRFRREERGHWLCRDAELELASGETSLAAAASPGQERI
ncbi:MAG TPA: glycosyltransferase family 2 protein [Terriglobales bacterium]|nr:glycosyltransferase family 2 protein [Terriglobales bacterium]